MAVRGRPGYGKVKFKGEEFSNSDFKFGFLDVIISEIKKKIRICKQKIINALFFASCFVFLRILRNKYQFTFILFDKESKSAIRIKKFLFSKFH